MSSNWRRVGPQSNKIGVLLWFIAVWSLVMSDSLRPHGLHHTRFPHPSLSPEACSNLDTKRYCCVNMKAESKTTYTSIKRKKMKTKTEVMLPCARNLRQKQERDGTKFSSWPLEGINFADIFIGYF